MDKNYRRMTDFLTELGIARIEHTEKSYLAHLVALHRLMEARGCTEELCRAGMFHSIYGTERFQGFKLPLTRRTEVRELIGERAERLAYLNCAMDRASFDRAAEGNDGPYQFIDRLTGEEVVLASEDFDDLCRIHLYDMLEQVARGGAWDHRRAAYRRLADRLGGVAVEEYDRVFAAEPAARA
jgi:hypothetical protein